ncbi:hypothetical protein IEO21_04831 [Rhodonia placenta]|uniref:Pop1 N-terminal domain-containing protein n=2 Tax=Rhodonia placenta TaxID=104341 RepID=A0A1X6MMK9_9APHY|nr:hypothetical protein POSPLADRAFT_1157483 [Postia placenta MAD-698-R-SB12]KAF9814981.1 hypothetical protein IEO21_04831 [Postia placenta]OSX57313.1 hypothetical protein POSPLADRAFT_1157483 [Postia placenta MAD-698-R-SB12]
MPPKRKDNSDAGDEPTARERKKQKTAIARTIAVQPTASSSTSGSNPVAGPSKSARAFEMKAMHDAMQSARSNSTQRAWQQLPRHLRRRAASHDVRRVPLRLRDKARAEVMTCQYACYLRTEYMAADGLCP